MKVGQALSPGLGTGPGTAPAPAPGDMKGCYSRLKELVPTLPQDRRVSRVEILQHVIDYIWDLQLELDSQDDATEAAAAAAAAAAAPNPAAAPGPGPRPLPAEAARVGADDRILCR
ncbi:DNA-binding protein inhibitor ID-1 [Ornithorhynchus anatinus]|uniref:DNA-binding protein inhibitor ID-1 n=1 Tax=Ornithorhynchus anatinus TaxID=9258 RepID=UPI0019D45A75|nr:DNA-binding protein inhibitor ID-1 [Ornithorhynchus anatinus]